MKYKLTALLILILVLLAIAQLYGYPQMLQMLPQGSHLWRQTYSMDMVLNYKLYDLPFLQPAVSNLASNGGRAAAEFPIFYYLAAQFDESEFILRSIHTFLFISGIIATYTIALYFLKDQLLSFLTSILLFTSPLLVFYGNNFLSDVPALSVAYMAWAFFLYASETKFRFLFYSLFFLLMSFSCLLKASQAINYGILLILMFSNRSSFLSKKFIFLFMLIITLIPLFCWYSYAKQYNTVHHHSYFFLGISPIWKLSFYEIGLTGWRILISWSKNYFWRPTSILLILCVFLYWKHRNRINRELNILLISSFIFTAIYLVMFYERLMKHEYYFITIYIFVLFWVITIFYICKKFYGEIISWIKVFAVSFLIANILYCKFFITEKLTDAFYNKLLATESMQSFLNVNGVSQNKTILSIPDDTPCKTLYLIKRKGFTNFNDYEKVLKNKQTDYILLTNNYWKTDKSLKPYLNDSIGFYNGFTLYKLK